MNLLIPFLLCFIPSSHSRLTPRSICTVPSYSSPNVDDTPSITAALRNCGDSGRIILPANITFTLRTPLDLSLCRACDFQVNGLISISSDWQYWSAQSAAILIRNASNLIIRTDSETGIYEPGAIDAQDFGWNGKKETLGKVPSLFDISEASYQVHIRDLRIRRAPGVVFNVRQGSNAVRIYDVETMTLAKEVLRVEGARHVYLWNDTLRATETCVRVLNGSSNVQVEESRCLADAKSGAVPKGLEIRLGEAGKGGLEWARNIFVRNVKVVGGMDVVALFGKGGKGKKVEIFNATLKDVEIEGPARKAVVLEQEDGVVLNATNVLFRGWEGRVQKEEKLKSGPKDFLSDTISSLAPESLSNSFKNTFRSSSYFSIAGVMENFSRSARSIEHPATAGCSNLEANSRRSFDSDTDEIPWKEYESFYSLQLLTAVMSTDELMDLYGEYMAHGELELAMAEADGQPDEDYDSMEYLDGRVSSGSGYDIDEFPEIIPDSPIQIEFRDSFLNRDWLADEPDENTRVLNPKLFRHAANGVRKFIIGEKPAALDIDEEFHLQRKDLDLIFDAEEELLPPTPVFIIDPYDVATQFDRLEDNSF
ncbi:pectin lyase fold/virulence factor [Dendryphion nanum]|uniref:Pectin lyase fold/virulence factor n=1 Tax=Dendryphion nanum TaxID=256645 RepID=A0A9P9EI14_9PLEO|nr:pectin lyase fold/virulence factor [Dendryphion nanum]